MDLASIIKNIKTEKSFVLFFMGQAGFIIKDKQGLTYSVDVYYSDCCEREFGFKRLMPKIINPLDITFDFVITTHEHFDHYDYDAMPLLMKDKKTRLITTLAGKELAKKQGFEKQTKTIIAGQTITVGSFKLTAVYCDHGELSKDAVGFIFETDGKKIYLVGDSAFHEEMSKDKKNIDILFVPINGAFGNMNETEAATFTKNLMPKVVVPCHYGNFAEHGGNLNKFTECFINYNKVEVRPLTIGEFIEL